MTGYYLEVGYIGGSSFGGSHEDAWLKMKEAAKTLCDDPQRIFDEAMRLDGEILNGTGEDVRGYAERYRNCDDLTITVHEKPFNESEKCGFKPYIAQSASGGGPSRMIKESLRRAFCRLIIEAMHREGIEVTMRVS